MLPPLTSVKNGDESQFFHYISSHVARKVKKNYRKNSTTRDPLFTNRILHTSQRTLIFFLPRRKTRQRKRAARVRIPMRDKVHPPCFPHPFIFLRQVLLANILGIMCTRNANVDPCPAACPGSSRSRLLPRSRVHTRAPCCSDIPGYHASFRVGEIKVTRGVKTETMLLHAWCKNRVSRRVWKGLKALTR